ncbi:MAG TPA: LamG-like jellyroll fold domain-containing protein [Phycisphaerae bacterium]|nr:LamG-like jellyroll fold domain-containing protein [Phycisphaerae bacterium]HUX02990.1 LamG-like jellyroll fold domain-containing protein [Phycisphaerae bacterium]
MQSFSVYPGATDADTLLLARADSGWLRGKSIVGPDFTNLGATPTPESDGWRFGDAERDYMNVALDGGARMAGTLECWIRNFTTPDTTYHYPVCWFEAGASRLAIFLRRSDPTSARIGVYFVDRNAANRSIYWQPNDGSIEALFDSPKPFHVAVTFCCDPQKQVAVIVNGKRYVGTSWSGLVGFSPTTLRLGRNYDGAAANDFYGVLDEVRVSNIERYSADFPITRFQEGERAGSRGPGETVEVAGGCV